MYMYLISNVPRTYIIEADWDILSKSIQPIISAHYISLLFQPVISAHY